MAFKLRSESRQIRNKQSTPIFKKKLAKGTIAEANMDGSIYVNIYMVPMENCMKDIKIIRGNKKLLTQKNHKLWHLK